MSLLEGTFPCEPRCQLQSKEIWSSVDFNNLTDAIRHVTAMWSLQNHCCSASMLSPPHSPTAVITLSIKWGQNLIAKPPWCASGHVLRFVLRPHPALPTTALAGHRAPSSYLMPGSASEPRGAPGSTRDGPAATRGAGHWASSGLENFVGESPQPLFSWSFLSCVENYFKWRT